MSIAKLIRFFSVFILAAISTLVTSCGSAQKPNVIIICTDDQDVADIGCYGGEVLTPNIDRLASEGIRFTRFYATSPIGTPSRYSLLTGRYASHCRAFRDRRSKKEPLSIRGNAFIASGERTLAHIMKDKGYVTGLVGKWQLGQPRALEVVEEADPNDAKIAENIRLNYEKFQYHIIRAGGFDYAESVYMSNLHTIDLPKTMQEHNMEWVTANALDFIEQNQENPFFLYFAPTVPRSPDPLASMKADSTITTAGFNQNISAVQPLRSDVFKRVEEAGLTESAAPLTWLDDGIGALLKKLDDLGLAENTIIVFTSDHGETGKMTTYESAARTPCIIRWKGVTDSAYVSDALVANIDIAPTIMDLCEVKAPEREEMNGLSWKPLLMEGKAPERNAVYLEVVYNRAVVTKEWKYMATRFPQRVREKITPQQRKRYAMTGLRTKDLYGAQAIFPGYYDDDQLYSLTDDLAEQNNLAADTTHAEKLLEMQNLLKKHAAGLPFPFGEFKTAQE